MTDRPIVILTATALEQQPFLDASPDMSTDVQFGRRRLLDLQEDRAFLFVETGIGAVNTAHALTSILEETDTLVVLQTGIAGAYPASGLSVGDVAVATEENYGDLGISSPDGWLPADEMGFSLTAASDRQYNRFPLDPSAVSTARDLLEEEGIRCTTGPFVTVQQVTGRSDLAEEMQARFSAVCENMEGAAAAHICAIYGAPFLELRGISNRVEDRDTSTWDIPNALSAVTRSVKVLLRNWPVP